MFTTRLKYSRPNSALRFDSIGSKRISTVPVVTRIEYNWNVLSEQRLFLETHVSKHLEIKDLADWHKLTKKVISCQLNK